MQDAPRYTVDVMHSKRPDPVGGVRVLGFHERSGTSLDMAIFPRPSCGIIIDCTEGRLESAGTASGLVGGMSPHAGRVRGSGIECLEIQFSPLVAAAVLDLPPVELNSPFIALEDIWGAAGERLRSQLVETRSWDRRFDLVSDALIKRHRGRRVEPEIADAWRRILRTGGQVSIAGLARAYDWSRTRLWSRFKAQVGVTPKRAAKIARFDRALRLITADADLATVAADCGYADQSHLNRDFASFGATAPGRLRDDPLWAADLSWDGREPAAGHDRPRMAEQSYGTSSARTAADRLRAGRPAAERSLPVGIPRLGGSLTSRTRRRVAGR